MIRMITTRITAIRMPINCGVADKDISQRAVHHHPRERPDLAVLPPHLALELA
jgi:hypothetical protein